MTDRLLPRRFDRDVIGVGLAAALVTQADVRLRDCPAGFDLTPHGWQLGDLDEDGDVPETVTVGEVPPDWRPDPETVAALEAYASGATNYSV